MKVSLKIILPLLATVLLVQSCQTKGTDRVSSKFGVNRRIEKHFEKFDVLSDEHKAMVAEGEVVEGMSKDAVFLAWGRADRVQQSSFNGQKSEQWDYISSESQPLNTIGYGTNGGTYGAPYGGQCDRQSSDGWTLGTDVHMVDVLSKSVSFAEGRVIGWQRVR